MLAGRVISGNIIIVCVNVVNVFVERGGEEEREGGLERQKREGAYIFPPGFVVVLSLDSLCSSTEASPEALESRLT